jgi:hypothetical protein
MIRSRSLNRRGLGRSTANPLREYILGLRLLKLLRRSIPENSSNEDVMLPGTPLGFMDESQRGYNYKLTSVIPECSLGVPRI